MPFRFEELNIWHRAMELNDQIFTLTKSFPKEEIYVLTSQIRRASDSIVLNIAEGSTGQTKTVFKLFLGYSLRSAIEVVGCLFIAKRRKYVDEERFQFLYSEYEVLVKMITSMRNSLK
ncbi:four helix bundle protein [Solitalea sp. MAHUQ-68]|uniref:Four helix bundle protein n=1 Tax=Solitalea agri TaxID=2953739 RepID=A0A9X2JG15_9SPHI|nr:four helix bundle protein [Solitalea agri]MCO4293966.1 four helix bundle protein [Solitalea agri]